MEPLSLRLLDHVPFRSKLSSQSAVPLIIGAVLTAILFSAIHFKVLPNYSVVLIFPAVIIGSYIKDRYFNYDQKWIGPQLISGTIIIYHNHILIRQKYSNDLTLSLNKVNAISIDHAYYNGYFTQVKNTRHIYSGACGLSFKLIDDNKTINFNLLINSKDELDKLALHLKHWYQIGIEVKETDPINNDLSVLFRTDWTYEQYQELKKELGVKEFFTEGQ